MAVRTSNFVRWESSSNFALKLLRFLKTLRIAERPHNPYEVLLDHSTILFELIFAPTLFRLLVLEPYARNSCSSPRKTPLHYCLVLTESVVIDACW